MDDKNTLQTKIGAVLAVAAFAVPFVIYLIGLMPGIWWLDSSEFVTTVGLQTLSHPPGHPSYHLVGKLFTLLPFGTVAYRVNLFSAAAMAFSHAVFFLILLKVCENARTTLSRVVLLLIAILPAFLNGFWLQAIRAEVYAFNLALVLLLIDLSLRIPEVTQRKQGILVGLFFLIFGLALSNQYLIVTSVVPALVFYLWIHFGRRLVGLCLRGCPWLFVGLLPYAYLLVLGRGSAPYGWGYIGSWSEFIEYVSAKVFRVKYLDPRDITFYDKLTSLFQYFIHQYHPINFVIILILAVIGGWLFFKESRKRFGFLMALFLGNIGVVMIHDFDPWNPDLSGYLAVSLLVPLMFVASLLARAVVTCGRVHQAIVILVVCSMAVPLGWAGQPFQYRKNRIAEELGLKMLSELPSGAVLFMSSFNTYFVLQYLQGVEGKRPDVKLIYRGLLGSDGYRRMLIKRVPELESDVGILEASVRPPATVAVYVEYGIQMEQIPQSVRAMLVPTGLFFRLAETAVYPTVAELETFWNGLLDGDLRLGANCDAQSTGVLIWLHYNHSRFYRERKMLDRAIWHLRRAAALNPDDEGMAAELKSLLSLEGER